MENFHELYEVLNEKKIDLVIVGPEKPLVEGVVDFLESKNIKVFGPRKKVAQLEGSKTFTKNICEKFKIPTAKFKICYTKEVSFSYLKSSETPDKRTGVSILIFSMSSKELAKQILNRSGQCIMTSPSSSLFAGNTGDIKIKLGNSLIKFNFQYLTRLSKNIQH